MLRNFLKRIKNWMTGKPARKPFTRKAGTTGGSSDGPYTGSQPAPPSSGVSVP